MHLGLKTQQIFFPLYRVVRAERRGGGDARVGWGGGGGGGESVASGAGGSGSRGGDARGAGERRR